MNILKYEDVFGVPFGKHGRYSESFGKRGDQPAEINPTELCIEIVGPLHEVDSASFTGDDQYGLGGDRVLILSKHPFAVPGDPENIQERYYMNGSHDGHITTYTSEDGSDPAPPRDENNQPKDRPEDWFVPATAKRYLTYKRLKLQADATHPPLTLVSMTKTGNGKPIPAFPEEGAESMDMYHPLTGKPGTWKSY